MFRLELGLKGGRVASCLLPPIPPHRTAVDAAAARGKVHSLPTARCRCFFLGLPLSLSLSPFSLLSTVVGSAQVLRVTPLRYSVTPLSPVWNLLHANSASLLRSGRPRRRCLRASERASAFPSFCRAINLAKTGEEEGEEGEGLLFYNIFGEKGNGKPRETMTTKTKTSLASATLTDYSFCHPPSLFLQITWRARRTSRRRCTGSASRPSSAWRSRTRSAPPSRTLPSSPRRWPTS